MRALLIVACLLLIVMALMRLPSALRSRLPSGPPRRDELVKDPVCQTYVLMSRAIREEAGGAPGVSARGERDGAAPAGYDLLVSDLDGTLLDDEMRLDPPLVEAFRRAA